MKHRLLIGAIALLCPWALNAQVPDETSTRQEETAALLTPNFVEEWVAENVIPEIEQGNATAASIAVVLDGEVLFAENLGEFDPVKSVPIEPQHQFMIASVSKTLNGLAAAWLLDKGLIESIHDPANRYLKRYQLPGDRGAKVTLAQLLSHSSGLEARAFGWSDPDQPTIPANSEYIEEMMPEIVREPGSGVVYANYGPPLFGVIVEDLTGLRYDEFLHTKLLQPLGIFDSRFNYDQTGGPTLVRAGVTRDGQPTVYAPVTVNSAFVAPAGSLQATAADMARYMNALLGNAPDVITPSMIATSQQDIAMNYPGLDAVGLGIIHGNWNELDTWFHGGLLAGFRTQLVLIPEKDIGVYISLAGGTGPYGGRGSGPGELADDLLIAVLGPVLPASPIEPVTDPAAVVGRYWNELRSHTTYETALALRRIDTVSEAEDGAILINGKPHDEIAPGLFQERRDDGRPPYLTALDGERLLVRLSFSERVSGMGDPGNIERLSSLSLIVLLTGVLSLFFRGRGRFAAPFAALSGGVLFYVVFWAMLTGPGLEIDLNNGIDWRFRLGAVLSWLIVLFGLVSLAGGFRGVAAKGTGILNRIGYAHRILIGFAAIGFFYALKLMNIA